MYGRATRAARSGSQPCGFIRERPFPGVLEYDFLDPQLRRDIVGVRPRANHGADFFVQLANAGDQHGRIDPACRKVFEPTGLRIQDIDVIESNEAFATQTSAVARELEFDPAKVNPNGSGISFGHPVGASGAIITTKAIYELQNTPAAAMP